MAILRDLTKCSIKFAACSRLMIPPNKSNIHFAEGKYRLALKHFQDAIGLYERLDSETARNELPGLFVNVGKCYQNIGQENIALDYYNIASLTW